jgi:serine protease Do
MNGVDISRFEFDYDTTWHAFFVDADLNVYSRYGGRDEKSADSRQSVASLLQTMREVLDVHARQQTQAASKADLHPSPEGGAAKRSTPEEIPLLKQNHQGCVHCHQVQEYRMLQAYIDKTFTKSNVFGFPLPENLGLRFGREHGHRADGVIPGSSAAQAGIVAGDIVVRVNDVPVHSEQDVRWALHRARGAAALKFVVSRAAPGGSPGRVDVAVELKPAAGWEQTELGWRRSLRSIPVALGFLGYALGAEERKAGGFPEDQLIIKVASIRGRGLAQQIGLAKGDLIVEIGERSAHRSFDEFRSDILRVFKPGDIVKLAVLREGKRVELSGPLPDWHTDSTNVP